MPDELMRCFLATKKDLRATHDKWSGKRVSNVAKAICTKKTGEKFVGDNNSINSMFAVTFGESGKPKNMLFTFKTDLSIIEKSKLKDVRPAYEINDPDSILVVGRAIWATESSNYNRYSEKELKKAAKTLIGAPCQIDHSESARDTFGIVTDAWWDNAASPPEIAYIAELDGTEVVAQRVKKGYIRGVSVSGRSEKALCSICGEEWDWMHEHFPGVEYKYKKQKKQFCFLDHINISFRHLGFTAFPAISGADANYIAASVSEALENVDAYINHTAEHGMIIKSAESEDQSESINGSASKPTNTNVLVFGESYSMSTENEVLEKLKKLEIAEYEKARLEKEKNELEAKLKQMEEAKAKTDATLNALKESERKRLINEVVDLQEKLDLTQGKSVEERRLALKDEHEMRLTAKVEALREMHERDEKDKQKQPQGSPITESLGGSRSRTFKGSKFDELDPQKKAFYEKEGKLAQFAFGLFGHLPAVGAVKTLSEYDTDRDRWNMDFAEMLKNAKRI